MQSEEQTQVYLKLDCNGCDLVSRNDLKVRFRQIGLVPERIMIDESKEKIVVLCTDPDSADRLRQCLKNNPELLDFVIDFVELGPVQAKEFDDEFQAKQKRNAAIRSLKRTLGGSRGRFSFGRK